MPDRARDGQLAWLGVEPEATALSNDLPPLSRADREAITRTLRRAVAHGVRLATAVYDPRYTGESMQADAIERGEVSC